MPKLNARILSNVSDLFYSFLNRFFFLPFLFFFLSTTSFVLLKNVFSNYLNSFFGLFKPSDILTDFNYSFFKVEDYKSLSQTYFLDPESRFKRVFRSFRSYRLRGKAIRCVFTMKPRRSYFFRTAGILKNIIDNKQLDIDLGLKESYRIPADHFFRFNTQGESDKVL